jgi:hypothetical protein
VKRKHLLFLALIFLCCLLPASTVVAQGTPSIDWSVVAGGGGPATGAGGIALNATLGQPIIGPSGEDSISLEGGYWYGVAAAENKIYLPVVLRSYAP